jgi:hypothetical protein
VASLGLSWVFPGSREKYPQKYINDFMRFLGLLGLLGLIPSLATCACANARIYAIREGVCAIARNNATMMLMYVG